MAKYLVHGTYTLDGVKGLVKEGGSSRKAKVAKNAENLGGKLEAFYYAFGVTTSSLFSICPTTSAPPLSQWQSAPVEDFGRTSSS